MSDEEDRAKEIDEAVKQADAKRRADAEMAAGGNDGERLDRCLAALDSISQRLDAYEMADKAKKDETASFTTEKEEPMNADEDREELKAAAGDLPGDPRKLAADSRADSVQFESAVAGLRNEIQYYADSAFQCWGENAPKPYGTETVPGYRRRIARKLQRHSPAWKDVDLHSLSGQSLRNAVSQIFADSIAASTNPQSYDAEFLREASVSWPDGRQVKEFYGRPSSWMRQFSGTPRRATLNRYPDGRDTRGA
jgi:hypothetical protein